MEGRRTTLLSEDCNATLAALLAADPHMSDLSVRKPSLEEAFTALTTTGATS